MSTRASLFFASDDGVKIHFFHDVEENKYYLEISCRDDFFDAQPARLCIHLPRIVEQALYQWVIDSGLATSKKASPDPGRIQQVPFTRDGEFCKGDTVKMTHPKRFKVRKNGEWIQPAVNFHTKCCNCGLVHRLEFRLHQNRLQFRAFRVAAKKKGVSKK